MIVEQKLAASNIVKKLEESNAQGDSIASMGKMLISDIVVGAQAIPTLKPIVDKLNDIYNLIVAGWNNEQFTTDQMNALVKDFETVYRAPETSSSEASIGGWDGWQRRAIMTFSFG